MCKSQPTDDKLSLIGTWSGHVTHYKILALQSYHWNGWTQILYKSRQYQFYATGWHITNKRAWLWSLDCFKILPLVVMQRDARVCQRQLSTCLVNQIMWWRLTCSSQLPPFPQSLLLPSQLSGSALLSSFLTAAVMHALRSLRITSVYLQNDTYLMYGPFRKYTGSNTCIKSIHWFTELPEKVLARLLSESFCNLWKFFNSVVWSEANSNYFFLTDLKYCNLRVWNLEL